MDKSRVTLFIPSDDAKQLKVNAAQQGTTLSDYVLNRAEVFEFPVNADIQLKVSHIGEVKQGTEFWRVDVKFIQTKTGALLRSNHYEIWASQDFIADYLKTSPNKHIARRDIAEFAFRLVLGRYQESNNELPKEYGAHCSRKTQVKLVKGRSELLSLFEGGI